MTSRAERERQERLVEAAARGVPVGVIYDEQAAAELAALPQPEPDDPELGDEGV